MSFGCRQFGSLMAAEYKGFTTILTVSPGVTDAMNLTGAQCTGLTTMGGVSIAVGTDDVFDGRLALDNTGGGDFRTGQVVVTVEESLTSTIGWSIKGSTDGSSYTNLTLSMAGNKLYGTDHLGGAHMNYQYYRVRYDRNEAGVDVNIQRIIASPYHVDQNVGVDWRTEVDGFATGGSESGGGTTIPTNTVFCYIDEEPIQLPTNCAHVDGIKIKKASTSGMLSSILAVGVVRYTAAGWRVIGTSYLGASGQLPVAANTYSLFFDEPINGVQSGDKWMYMGLNCGLEYDTSLSTKSREYVGTAGAPWAELTAGTLIPHDNFNTSTKEWAASSLGGKSGPGVTMYTDHFEGTGATTNSGRGGGSLKGIYGSVGPAIKVTVKNMHSTDEKDIAVCPSMGDVSTLVVADYVPNVTPASRELQLLTRTPLLHIDPYSPGDALHPRGVIPNIGRGCVIVQDDSTQAAPGSRKYIFLKWAGVKGTTGTDLLTLLGINWYVEDSGVPTYGIAGIDFLDELTDDSGLTIIDEGALFMYVPWYLEFAEHVSGSPGTFYNIGDTVAGDLPVIETGVTAGSTMDFHARVNLGGIDAFDALGFPKETWCILETPSAP